MVVRYLNGPLNPPSIQEGDGDTLDIVTSGNTQTITGAKTFTSTLASTAGFVATGGINDALFRVVPFMPTAVQEDLSGAGAVSTDTYYTAWTTGGAVAGTLADGVRIGQLKRIRSLTADEGTLTFNVDDTIVFTDAGDTALLIWNGADWVPIELSNDADGATAPVYATS